MGSVFDVTLALCLLPIALGVLGRFRIISSPVFRPIALTAIVLVAGGFVANGSMPETVSPVMLLTTAVLLSGFCAVLGQHDSKIASLVFSTTMIGLGLSLGALLAQAPFKSVFLIGILAYAAYRQIRQDLNTLRGKLVLLQLVAVVILTSAALVLEDISPVLVGLCLGVTLLPLAPFHLPFASIVGSAQGTLSSFWVVSLLALGLNELNSLHLLLPANVLSAIGILAVMSALYGSMKCVGQSQVRSFIAYATVAQVSLLWGLPSVFSSFSVWAIPFGTTVAFVMSGLLLTFAFVEHRYGSHSLGILSGLGAPMPRLGTLLTLLVTFGMLLPIVPMFSGLTTVQSGGRQVVSFLAIFSMLLTVWLFGSWYFSDLLHRTVFGKVRPDIPYTDLRNAEVIASGLLILSATYAGLLH